MNPMPMKHRVALVCGASRGIGRAIAEEFAAQGATIIALARTEATLRDLCANLPQPSSGPGHQALALDCSDLAVLRSRVSSTLERFQRLDILVNNTAGPKGGPIVEAGIDEYQSAFQHHLFPAVTLSQLAMPYMQKARFGRIINILSTSIKIPIHNLGVSNTMRSAMANWSKTLANEVGHWGITVNNILPGFTMTDRLTTLLAQSAEKRGVSRDIIEAEWLASIPAKRFAAPQEVAKAALFLASEDAGYVHGISLPVDGGRTGCL